MAELHIIGQIESACDFEEPTLFCKWSIQYGNYRWEIVFEFKLKRLKMKMYRFICFANKKRL